MYQVKVRALSAMDPVNLDPVHVPVLNNDCLVAIFSYLDVASIKAAALVSR